MSSLLPRISLIAALCASAACAPLHRMRSVSQTLTGANCSQRIYDRIYFGLMMNGKPVAKTEWDAFVERAIAPKFPGGYTVSDANGQWRNAQGHIVREPSKILEIIHDGHAESRKAIQEITSAYKRDFLQESVMLVELHSDTCF